MSYIKNIGGQDMEIGEYTSYISDYETRVKVFAIEVVGLNNEHKNKTSEDYLTRLAMALIYRLLPLGRIDLTDKIIQSMFEAGYTRGAYKAKLYIYTLQKLAEQGIVPMHPMKSKTTAHLP